MTGRRDPAAGRLAGLAALVLACAALLAGCGGGDDPSGPDQGRSEGPTERTTTRVEVVEGLAKGDGMNAQEIYKEEAPGVVTVFAVFGGGGVDSIPGGDGGGDGQSGVGSGFVLNGDGEIATNAHVVSQGEGSELRRAREVYVEFADGNQVPARIRGEDPNADVALLKVNTRGLTLRPLPLGESSEVQVGTPVAAIGSPFGERQSLSVGVVSAVDRSIQSLTNFQISGAIQTDAAINPGNSGGPLVDEDGRVIGINQQIKSNSGGGEGVGFAVPVDLVKRSLGQLRETGEVEYAYLGVSSVALYPQLVDRFDLPVDKGAWLQEVTPGAPADRAGLEGGNGDARFQARAFRDGGDVVTRLGRVPIEDSDDLSAAVERYRPGDVVTLQVWRDGKARDVRIKLGERPLSRSSGG
jgi:S1-C subfamily serine protease